MTDFRDEYVSDLRSLNERLLAIEHVVDNLTLPLITLTEVYTEPTRPRGGQVVFADGTQWDPGSGRGIYSYNDNTSAWVQVVSLP